MDALKEYKIKQLVKRKEELGKILNDLINGNLLNALYAIYNNAQDADAMTPIIKNYFENQLEETENKLKAYRHEER